MVGNSLSAGKRSLPADWRHAPAWCGSGNHWKRWEDQDCDVEDEDEIDPDDGDRSSSSEEETLCWTVFLSMVIFSSPACCSANLLQ